MCRPLVQTFDLFDVSEKRPKSLSVVDGDRNNCDCGIILNDGKRKYHVTWRQVGEEERRRRMPAISSPSRMGMQNNMVTRSVRIDGNGKGIK